MQGKTLQSTPISERALAHSGILCAGQYPHGTQLPREGAWRILRALRRTIGTLDLTHNFSNSSRLPHRHSLQGPMGSRHLSANFHRNDHADDRAMVACLQQAAAYIAKHAYSQQHASWNMTYPCQVQYEFLNTCHMLCTSRARRHNDPGHQLKRREGAGVVILLGWSSSAHTHAHTHTHR